MGVNSGPHPGLWIGQLQVQRRHRLARIFFFPMVWVKESKVKCTYQLTIFVFVVMWGQLKAKSSYEESIHRSGIECELRLVPTLWAHMRTTAGKSRDNCGQFFNCDFFSMLHQRALTLGGGRRHSHRDTLDILKTVVWFPC